MSLSYGYTHLQQTNNLLRQTKPNIAKRSLIPLRWTATGFNQTANLERWNV